MKSKSIETSSVYLLKQSSASEDCCYSYNHHVGASSDFLPTKAFHKMKICKSEQDLVDDSETTKVAATSKEFSFWFPYKEISAHNNQGQKNTNNNNKNGTCKRSKSETEVRKMNNNSNDKINNDCFLDSRLTEVGDEKFKRYLRMGDASIDHNSLFTLNRIVSFLVTFVSSTYAAFFVYLLSNTKNSYLLAQSLHWVFPSLMKDHSEEMLEDLEVGHCDFTMVNLAKIADIFLLAHFLGYAGKMILFRDFGFTWLISISWEFTEIFYSPILPNFIECWWDLVLFDICICNATGIVMGSLLLKGLGISQLNWYEHSNSYHIQHSPQPPRWKSMLVQAWYVFILLFFCNMAELNSFTLKRVFGVNKKHPLNAIRLLIHAFMSHNVISAYRKVLRGIIKPSELRVQFWIYLLAIGLELACVLKHGPLYTVNLLPNMACWLSMLFVGSILYVILATFANFICYGAADCKTE